MNQLRAKSCSFLTYLRPVCSSSINFSIKVDTSAGILALPRTFHSIALDGRQSKVIVTDYTFGASRVLYSTAGIFFAGKIGSRDVLFLFGDSNQSHEAALHLTGASKVKPMSSYITTRTSSTNELSTITVMPGSTGLVTIWESDSQTILFSDSVTAAKFWAPVIPGPSTLGDYWQLGSNQTVLVGGPYLVRNATIKGSRLALTGDLNASVQLTVIAPSQIKTVSWNGAVVQQDLHLYGDSAIFRGRLERKISSNAIPMPKLDNWKFADSLPEIKPGFSDASWITANHTTTNIITHMLYGDGRILYGTSNTTCLLHHGDSGLGCDYGL